MFVCTRGGQKMSKSDTIVVNIIISADEPSPMGTIQYANTTRVHHTNIHIYTGARIMILMRMVMAPTRIYIRTNKLHIHTRTHTYMIYMYVCMYICMYIITYNIICIAHIIIIFRTPLYCLRVSHMLGAPSLMVLTIWMQISERKPPTGYGLQCNALSSIIIISSRTRGGRWASDLCDFRRYFPFSE